MRCRNHVWDCSGVAYTGTRSLVQNGAAGGNPRGHPEITTPAVQKTVHLNNCQVCLVNMVKVFQFEPLIAGSFPDCCQRVRTEWFTAAVPE